MRLPWYHDRPTGDPYPPADLGGRLGKLSLSACVKIVAVTLHVLYEEEVFASDRKWYLYYHSLPEGGFLGGGLLGSGGKACTDKRINVLQPNYQCATLALVLSRTHTHV